MATYLDGNVRRATPNTVKAMQRSAESRRCPNCQRKSALTRFEREDGQGRLCRWCGWSDWFSIYTRVRVVESQGDPKQKRSLPGEVT